MGLRAFLSPIDSVHERQDMEVEDILKQNPRIGSFQRIKRNSEGLGGGELIVDKTRQSIIYLVTGILGIPDLLSHRLMYEEYVKGIPFLVGRIHDGAKGFDGTSHFTLVRNAASADLITAVRDGGLKTAIVIDSHGCKTWVNMTDGGKRVTNKMLRSIVGDEKIGAIVKASCDESAIEDDEVGIPSNEEIFGNGIAEKTLRAPFFK